MTTLERTSVPIAALKPSPYNPRRIDALAQAALERSLDRFGVVQDIVVNRRNMRIVGGHQRVAGLRNLGEVQAPIIFVDLDDGDEKALNIALNSPKLAGEFTEALQTILAELEGDRADLFLELRLRELREDHGGMARGDKDDAPELPTVPPQTQPGDLWILGRHRLVCGDSADAATIAAVLQGEKVHQLLTDPPYGVSYGKKTQHISDAKALHGLKGATRADLQNDDRTDYRAWFGTWLRLVPWNRFATIYIFMSGTQLHNLRLAFDDAGYIFSSYLCWVKDVQVMGRFDYHLRHEWLAKGKPKRTVREVTNVAYGWPARHRFYAIPGSRQTVLDYPRPRKSELHPTMKPVAMLEQLIGDGCPDGGVVFDGFAGSGSTLIAAETTGRKARLVELDPGYCDVIAQRYREFSGDEPQRVPVAEVA